jgi:hypothetical protein
MSLRDIEKAVALYSFSGVNGEGSWIIVYLIALKVKEPQLYKKLVDGDTEAHSKAKEMIEVFERQNAGGQHLLEFFKKWHEAYKSGFTDVSEEFISQLPFRYRHQGSPEELFASLASKIDLNID